jgi:hypothetical protein
MDYPIAKAELKIPQFGPLSEMVLDISNIQEGERRLVEAKTVNVSTFSELSYCFNESYRECRKHMSVIGYQIAMTEKEINKVKSRYLLDEYQEMIKEKKIKDSTDIRESYLVTKEDYATAIDRLALLKATESFIEGKIKVFENVCSYMKKEIDLTTRSSMNPNHYIK